jgi:hypothetical protein
MSERDHRAQNAGATRRRAKQSRLSSLTRKSTRSLVVSSPHSGNARELEDRMRFKKQPQNRFRYHAIRFPCTYIRLAFPASTAKLFQSPESDGATAAFRIADQRFRRAINKANLPLLCRHPHFCANDTKTSRSGNVARHGYEARKASNKRGESNQVDVTPAIVKPT